MDNKEMSFENYCNFIKEIFGLINIVDKNGKKFILNVRKPIMGENTSSISINYLYGEQCTMKNICEVVLSKEIYNLNDIMKEKCPDFIIFLENLISEYNEFDLLLLCILHEFGHVNLELVMEKINMNYEMDMINDLSSNLKKNVFNKLFTTNFNTDYLYRLNPNEIYADHYAYTNYIDIHKKLERKNILKNKLNIPIIKDDRNDIGTIKRIISTLTINDYTVSFDEKIKSVKVDNDKKHIYLKEKIKTLYNNSMRNFFKIYLKEDNKNMKTLFWYISAILFKIEIQENDLLYIYSNSLGTILSTYKINEKDFSESMIVDNIALIHFFEYIHKINEFDLSKIK